MKYFSTILNHSTLEESTYIPEPHTEQNMRDLRNEIIPREVVESPVSSLKDGKSPGSDLIPNEIIKWWKPVLTPKLSDLFTKAY